MVKSEKSKKVHREWILQSSDLDNFEKEINSNLEIGWEILEGSYNIIEKDGENIYSQVLVWRDEDDVIVSFDMHDEYGDGLFNESTGNRLMTFKRTTPKDSKGEWTTTVWRKYKYGGKYGKETKVEFYFGSDRQLRRKYFQRIDETGKIHQLFEYNKEGIKHGKYINQYGNLKGKIVNGDEIGQLFFFTDPNGGGHYSGIFTRYDGIDASIYLKFYYFGAIAVIFQIDRGDDAKDAKIYVSNYSKNFPIETLLEKGDSGNIQFLSFKHRLSDDENNTPSFFFEGQIITEKKDNPKFNEYYIKSGKFVEFARPTFDGYGEMKGIRRYETIVHEGTRDYIKSGTFTVFSDTTGKELRRAIIEEGTIKENNDYHWANEAYQLEESDEDYFRVKTVPEKDRENEYNNIRNELGMDND